MGDAIPCILWSIDGSDQKSLPIYRSLKTLPDDADGLVERLDLREAFDAYFPVTRPRWFGLWINSPLAVQQCDLLLRLFLQHLSSATTVEDDIEEFLDALRKGKGGAVLDVEHSKPAHVDLGWITTFAHCPQCKAEGPCERWQESYSTKPIDCPVCGRSYAPASTIRTVRHFEFQIVRCEECSAAFDIDAFSDSQQEALEEVWLHRKMIDEYAWLLRVEAFYQRHPEMRDRVVPHVIGVLRSDDPNVWKQLADGRSIGDITLPKEDHPIHWSMQDRDVVEYLRRNHVRLEPRMKFVKESLRQQMDSPIPPVRCPQCSGVLRPQPA